MSKREKALEKQNKKIAAGQKRTIQWWISICFTCVLWVC